MVVDLTRDGKNPLKIRLGLCMGRISWNDFSVLKSMIFGQLNCFLFLEFFRSSARILDSVLSPFLICLSSARSIPDFVGLLKTFEDAGQNLFLSPTKILSSRLGKTIIFKDVTGSIAKIIKLLSEVSVKNALARHRLPHRTTTKSSR